ncbi:MAG: CoA transferase [Gammaproteobacteria bacterium]|nr:CoA transferase [Gammaproteobacteria bacterium]
MGGPLSGIRIVDLTTMISGPYATMILADQGADVIKVESTTTGDLMRHLGPSRAGIAAIFLNCNRSKRSISLDLKQSSACEALNRLIATADVLVQNFRPGAIQRMGFGEDAVRKIRPDILYVSISGFGESGPYMLKRVYDPVIQAVSGIMAAQGGGGPPQSVRTLLPDKLTAVTAAQAITAGLLHRALTGEGQHIRLAMLDAIVAWLWPDNFMNDTLQGDGVSAPLELANVDLAFETRDGGYIATGFISDDEWQGFTRAAEQPELLEDARFKDAVTRIANFEILIALIGEIVRTDDKAHWLRRLDEEQVPCGPINDTRAVLDDPQVVENELISEYRHPAAGLLHEVRPAARFDATPSVGHRHTPSLGEHTTELLEECGFDSRAIAALRDSGAAVG